jgi:hypothetical protein
MLSDLTKSFPGRRNDRQVQFPISLLSLLLSNLILLLLSIGSKQDQEQEQEADLDLRLFSEQNSRLVSSHDAANLSAVQHFSHVANLLFHFLR